MSAPVMRHPGAEYARLVAAFIALRDHQAAPCGKSRAARRADEDKAGKLGREFRHAWLAVTDPDQREDANLQQIEIRRGRRAAALASFVAA